MKTNLLRFLFAALALCLLPIATKAIPDWMPGKRLLISRSINSWNSANKAKVTVDLQRLGLFKTKLPGWLSESTVLTLTGKITNNSADTLAAVVIDYIVSNKRTNTEVLRLRLALQVAIYKTAVVELKNPFVQLTYALEKQVSIEVAKAAWEQLGADYQWRYEFVAAMPQSILADRGNDAYEALNAQAILIEATP